MLFVTLPYLLIAAPTTLYRHATKVKKNVHNCCVSGTGTYPYERDDVPKYNSSMYMRSLRPIVQVLNLQAAPLTFSPLVWFDRSAGHLSSW